MRFVAIVAAFGVVAAATARIDGWPPAQPRAGVDSITLERTACFGTCPAYRLSVRRTGEVHFTSYNPGERIDTVGHVASSTLDSLVVRAMRAHFYALPDHIDHISPLCPGLATDHPSLTLTFYGRVTKRVTYYTGCYLRNGHTRAPELEALARLAVAVDSATGARRWIHPAMR